MMLHISEGPAQNRSKSSFYCLHRTACEVCYTFLRDQHKVDLNQGFIVYIEQYVKCVYIETVCEVCYTFLRDQHKIDLNQFFIVYMEQNMMLHISEGPAQNRSKSIVHCSHKDSLLYIHVTDPNEKN